MSNPNAQVGLVVLVLGLVGLFIPGSTFISIVSIASVIVGAFMLIFGRTKRC